MIRTRLGKAGCVLESTKGATIHDYVQVVPVHKYVPTVKIVRESGEVAHLQTMRECQFLVVSNYTNPKYSEVRVLNDPHKREAARRQKSVRRTTEDGRFKDSFPSEYIGLQELCHSDEDGE